MSETYRCGDQEWLAAYLYDECEPTDRAAIALHLAGCAHCAEEIAALSDTRRLLAAWTPPEVSLGWRLSHEDRGLAVFPSDGARAPERTRAQGAAAWWRQPLPAWAQAAAAVLIFAAGLTVGESRRAVEPAQRPAPDLRAALAAIEGRLDAAERSARVYEAARAATVAQPFEPPPDVMRRVRGEIVASEERMRGEVAEVLLQVKREERRSQQLLSEDVDAKLDSHSWYVTQLVAQE